MMKHFKQGLALTLSAAVAAGLLTGCSSSAPTAPVASAASQAASQAAPAAAAIDGAGLLDPAKPTTVTVWNYYNGDQLTAFETLVSEFNSTVGAEKGIVVVSVSQGSIDNLASALLDSVNGKAGADDVPSAAAVYSETSYILNNQDAIVALDDYFSADELAEYVPAFLTEGRLTEDGPLTLLPVSKSTEAFVVNTTDWEAFAAESGISADSIASYEDLTAAAEAYYNWTDAQTPDVPEDGKALYGRDSVANYIVIGTKQLGHEMFKVGADGTLAVDMDKATFKTLWDNYYIPYINGYFGAYTSYRSEDLKTGAILALTSSTSGTSYIPTAVTNADDTTHDITVSVNKPLSFAGSDPVAVQQGAGYCVLKTNDAEQFATVEFLKWFTDTDQNLNFSISSGYSPVKLAANDAAVITKAFTVDSPKSQNMLNALLLSAEVYAEGNTYTSPAFNGSKAVRDVLSDALINACSDDRAAVQEAIAGGASRADAVAPYVTDEYFDSWFTALCDQVNATVG